MTNWRKTFWVFFSLDFEDVKLLNVCSVKISTLGNLVAKVTKAPLYRQDNFVNYKVLGHKITLRLMKEIISLFLYLLDEALRYTSCMGNFIVLNIGVVEPYFKRNYKSKR